MYTLQAGQIENALRTGGANDVSAKQMVQQLANCQQLLEHRGNVELTKPAVNNFPTIQPASNSVSYPFTYKDVYLTVPPFQMQEWKPQPYIPMPPWQNVEYPEWPGLGWQGLGDASASGGKPLSIPGGASLGSTTIRDGACGPFSCTDLKVSGGAGVGGDLGVGGDARIGGDMYVGGNLTVQNSATFNGPVDMAGPVTIGGVSLTPRTATVVSDVFWDGGALKATVRTIRFFGFVQRTLTKTVISGTACP